jgi:hypothetical protein
MSSVTVLHAVAIFSVFAVGLIAGQMLAIGIANYAARGLPETSWTLRFQSENNLFSKTMPPFLIAPALRLGLSRCKAAPRTLRQVLALHVPELSAR